MYILVGGANEKESVIFETCKVGIQQQQQQVFFISVTPKIHSSLTNESESEYIIL